MVAWAAASATVASKLRLRKRRGRNSLGTPKGEMAMAHVEQPSLRLGGGFGGAPHATVGAEAALAGEADGVVALAIGAAITDIPALGSTAAERFRYRLARRGSDLGWQAPIQQALRGRPVVAQDGVQQPQRF